MNQSGISLEIPSLRMELHSTGKNKNHSNSQLLPLSRHVKKKHLWEIILSLFCIPKTPSIKRPNIIEMIIKVTITAPSSNLHLAASKKSVTCDFYL